MPWRKWLIRSLVFSVVGACAGVALVYQRWTNPTAVQHQLMARLQTMYPGAIVTMDSARLRLLGGIVVNDARLYRRDDPGKVEFAHVPSAILYHDKEKMLDGPLVLRKVELHRPRLRVVRERDGTWNLAGILGPSQPDVPLPTVVIHQGTIIVEDHQEGSNQAPLEVKDIDVCFLNDPLSTVVVSGTASSDLTGLMQLKATYRRASKDLAVNVKARGMPLKTAFVQRLQTSCPNHNLADLTLDARADLEADLAYRPEQTEPFQYDVRLRISKGNLRHPKIPLPLTDVCANLQCSGGVVRVRDFHARSGKAILSGQASAVLPCVDQFFEAALEIKDAQVDSEVAARLPEKIRKLQQAFQASGTTGMRLACGRRDGKWVNLSSGAASRITLLPKNFDISFVKFPYPLAKVSGSLEWDLQSQRTLVDITGYTHDRPVLVRGLWQGEGLESRAQFDIQASDVPVEDKLIAALPPRMQKLTISFHPTGRIDVKSHLHRAAGSTEFLNEYHIGLRDSTICWDEFPYPLENVSGFLDIYPRHWEFRDGKGSFQGAEVAVQARSKRAEGSADAGDGMLLDMSARNLPLDQHLLKALGRLPQLARAWETFQPMGRLNFTAAIERPSGQPDNMDVQLEVAGGSLEPVFFPYALRDLSGRFRFHDNRLDIRNVRARHDKVRFELDQGAVAIIPGGGHHTDLSELRVFGLAADTDLLKALPKPLRSTMESLELKEPVDVKTRLVVSQAPEQGSPAEVWWDGQLVLRNAHLKTGVAWSGVTGTLACTGRHNGRQLQGLTGNVLLEQAALCKQPFKNVNGKFHVKEGTPEVLTLGLHAPIYGGDITGQARVEFTSALRYELNLTASHIDLKEFGVHNLGPTSQLNGLAVGRLYLTGLGASIDTLDGNGSIDVPNGRLYNLPLLLDLLKFLGLRWPDRTAFEEFHALFAINGNRVTMRRLELTGNAVSLSGKGDFRLDGTEMNLDFYPSWARVEQLLPPVVRPIPPALSKNLLTIEMRGKVSSHPEELRFNKKVVPVLFDPLLLIRDRILGPSGQAGN